eukprot:gene11059-12317_t
MLQGIGGGAEVVCDLDLSVPPDRSSKKRSRQPELTLETLRPLLCKLIEQQAETALNQKQLQQLIERTQQETLHHMELVLDKLDAIDSPKSSLATAAKDTGNNGLVNLDTPLNMQATAVEMRTVLTQIVDMKNETLKQFRHLQKQQQLVHSLLEEHHRQPFPMYAPVSSLPPTTSTAATVRRSSANKACTKRQGSMTEANVSALPIWAVQEMVDDDSNLFERTQMSFESWITDVNFGPASNADTLTNKVNALLNRKVSQPDCPLRWQGTVIQIFDATQNWREITKTDWVTWSKYIGSSWAETSVQRIEMELRKWLSHSRNSLPLQEDE